MKKFINNLPKRLAVFPLNDFILIPGGKAPLRIFEQRYKKLLNDTLANEQKIFAMIQPHWSDDNKLQTIGCAVQITSYCEGNNDDAWIIVKSLSRFILKTEVTPVHSPYRIVWVDYKPYAQDSSGKHNTVIKSMDASSAQWFREQTLHILQQSDVEIQHGDIIDASISDLIDILSTLCPFDPSQKQALLEAPTIDARAKLLLTLLEKNQTTVINRTLH